MSTVKRAVLFFLLLLFAVENIYTQPPEIVWEKTFGGADDDAARSICITSDNGCIISGYTDPSDDNYPSLYRYFMVKLNSVGDTIWTRVLNMNGSYQSNSIQQTSDGGYIIAGHATIYPPLTFSHTCILKLDPLGDTIWTKAIFSGAINTSIDIRSICQTTDGGYILAGYFDYSLLDYQIMKLNNVGDSVWSKSYGGSKDDIATSIQQTSDGGYIVAGYSSSTDGDLIGRQSAMEDYWIIKLDSYGNKVWSKYFGGSNNDKAQSIKQTSEGGFIVAGTSYLNGGDVSGNHGSSNFWVIKLNSNGDSTWSKILGGPSADQAFSIQQTYEGGYIAAGTSCLNGGDVSGNNGGYDFWLVKLDSSGNISWSKSLGGSNQDIAYSIMQTSDRGYIVAGSTLSNDSDITVNHGGDDVWVVKLTEGSNLVKGHYSHSKGIFIKASRTLVVSNIFRTFYLSLIL